MPRPIQPEIIFAHLPRSDALESAIRRRVEHLQQFCADLHACRVVVEQTHRHAQQGRPFEVRVDVTLNGRELVVNRSRDEDVYIALREAFADITRQVEDTVRRRRAGARYRETVRRMPGTGLDAQAAASSGGGASAAPSPSATGDAPA